ncbi:DUF1553 domain-containing protein [Humisphaera borealis]|uniref:DUF1553 domain-containing protein n=1 Tax=Humisphaera borealis TaxID=2807512 RepID=A0A7M2X0W4_9BACT|nr:DUF1553 domain-containing protein [Humisphaera borealis]QOV91309.1 DUF1553 domain-containing protein [Humisphaera borealis]
MNHPRSIYACTALVITLVTAATAVVAEAPKPDPAGVAFFEQKVRPVLVEHCYECHSASAKKVRGGLLLDSRPGWQKGGDSMTPAIVPGDPARSLLIRSIRHETEDLAMPPKKPKLPDGVIADLSAWVKMGAPDPRDGTAATAKRADKDWWSLQPLSKPVPPAVADVPAAWAESPIDSFIFAKLAAEGLKPNPPADARVLVRRMTYDVIGLPPTQAETDAFIAAYTIDPRKAVEALADRLLASPHYGEQWGRHWLDVVRFGESNGFERNFIIDDLWPFRDYVIRSLNEDKPFNRFIVEHLAGDVVGKDDPSVEVATAFIVAGPYDDVGNQDPVAKANIRAATLDDPITATASAFLGLTINCARCHNHKFDPIPAEDYYRIRAAFEGIEHGRRVVASKQEREEYTAATKTLNQDRARLTAEKTKIEAEINARAATAAAGRKFSRPKVDPRETADRFTPIEARYAKLILHAHTGNPRSAAGSRLGEVEIWTAESPAGKSFNAAAASAGATATGARSRQAADFPDAYGPQLTIDGKLGEQWFIGTPAELTITFAKAESIDRLVFINTQSVDPSQKKATGETPCEYELQTSLDGKQWVTVTSGADREPWSPEHGLQRLRREVTTENERTALAKLDRDLAAVQAKLDAVPPLRQVWAGKFNQPKDKTFLQKGGDPMKPAAEVTAGSLAVLDRVAPAYSLSAETPESQRRLALANWIASDSNALVLRVLANRVWHYHFGTGIVDTPGDFGYLGGQPTHPELLDWLAGRLLHHGWKLKPLHREILLSQAYLQSSASRDDGSKKDKDARLLWRFPPRRLAAEEIRDTMLAVSGKLNTTPGGPGFRLYRVMQDNVSTYFPLDKHGPETYRRAVYHQNARASVVDLLTEYDLPDTAFAAPRRARTTSPLQALTLLNHSFTIDMAAALADRVAGDLDRRSTAEKVDRVYSFVFQRAPTDDERAAAVKLVEMHGLKALCRAMLNANELLFVE